MRRLLPSLFFALLAAAPLSAAEPVDSLVKDLAGEDAAARLKAAAGLVAQGPAAVPALTKLLAHESPAARAYAAYALGQIGEPSKPAAPELVKLVADREVQVRRAAIRALHSIKPDRAITLPLLAKVLEESDPSIVLPALHSIAELGAEAVPPLKEALKNPKARYWALLVARDLRGVAAPAVPEIAAALDSDEEETRMQAALALAEIGPAAKPAALKLGALLKGDKLDGVKYAAAHALTRIGDQKASADLAAAVSATKDPFLKMIATFGVSQLNPGDPGWGKAAVAAIIGGLKSSDARMKATAAQMLAESKVPSEIAAPAMEAAMENASPEVVASVVAAVAKVGAPAVPRVVRGLANPKLRPLALRVLAAMGPASAGAVGPIVKELEGEAGKDPEFRREAQYVLSLAGPAAAPAVPELVKSLTSETDEVRHTAILALGKIGAGAKAAVPELRKNVMAQEDKFDKLASVWAIVKIQPDPPVVLAAIPILTAALGHEREAVRAEAARTLGEIGPPAKIAVPALKKLLADPSPAVQAAAKEALGKLGG